ncbi:hypothetical protein BDY24DRAFT_138672 [Mrakia frigida]|uniref:uncharacterized protein n=1 Tax=Mrakia frigida TaxID=29902 RepID=UPI003FCC0FAC
MSSDLTLPLEVIERILKLALGAFDPISPHSPPSPPTRTSHLLLLSRGLRELALPLWWRRITIVNCQDWVVLFGEGAGLLVVGEEGQKRWAMVEVLEVETFDAGQLPWIPVERFSKSFTKLSPPFQTSNELLHSQRHVVFLSKEAPFPAESSLHPPRPLPPRCRTHPVRLDNRHPHRIAARMEWQGPPGLTKFEEEKAWNVWWDNVGQPKADKARLDEISSQINVRSWQFFLSSAVGFQTLHVTSLAHYPNLFAHVQHSERVETVVLHHPSTPSAQLPPQPPNSFTVPTSTFTFTSTPLPSSPSQPSATSKTSSSSSSSSDFDAINLTVSFLATYFPTSTIRLVGYPPEYLKKTRKCLRQFGSGGRTFTQVWEVEGEGGEVERLRFGKNEELDLDLGSMSI